MNDLSILREKTSNAKKVENNKNKSRNKWNRKTTNWKAVNWND